MDDSDAHSSDSEAILELEAEAAAVQHRLALAKLERKRKRPEQEPNVVPGPAKKKKTRSGSRSRSISPRPDHDADMAVTGSSSLSRPSKHRKAERHSKHTKKPAESSEEEEETQVDRYWRKAYKKKPKGMHMTYPKNSNYFSASPWGLINDSHGWNEFLGYIRTAVASHFNVNQLWSKQQHKHESFYKLVVCDYPVLTWQKGYFTITQTAAANLRYRVSLDDPSTSKKSRKSGTSTSVTPSVSRSSAAPSATSSLSSIATPDSATAATPQEGIIDDLIDPALLPSAQVLAPILSMGGEDYGLPDMPVTDVPDQQLPGPSAPPDVNPATHFNGSLPSQDPVPSTHSRRTMVYQASRGTALSITSHDAPSVEPSSAHASSVQAPGVVPAQSQVSTASNPHLSSTSASISPSDAASILLDISQQVPAAHPFRTDTTPRTALLDEGTHSLVVPSTAKPNVPKAQQAKANGAPRKATQARGAPQKASVTPAEKAGGDRRRSTRRQK